MSTRLAGTALAISATIAIIPAVGGRPQGSKKLCETVQGDAELRPVAGQLQNTGARADN